MRQENIQASDDEVCSAKDFLTSETAGNPAPCSFFKNKRWFQVIGTL
jgi:hypothetical protein